MLGILPQRLQNASYADILKAVAANKKVYLDLNEVYIYNILQLHEFLTFLQFAIIYAKFRYAIRSNDIDYVNAVWCGVCICYLILINVDVK